jgi:DNA-binding LacI/PurR family transcriptional regulator
MVSSVTNDHYRAMCEAVEEVAERGHRRIGLVWSGETVDNATERYRAYHDEMKRRGLPCRPEWEFIYKTPMQSLRHRLAASDRPTALLSTSTHALPQLFEALAANGLEVPRDVSLLAVDSAPEGSPALTGLVRPVSRHYLQWDSIVHTAMKEVLAVARGDSRIRHVVLPVPFRDEGTVAPPPAS